MESKESKKSKNNCIFKLSIGICCLLKQCKCHDNKEYEKHVI
jgi:hypothetical protein